LIRTDTFSENATSFSEFADLSDRLIEWRCRRSEALGDRLTSYCIADTTSVSLSVIFSEWILLWCLIKTG
jgi:hypothetical protein